MKQATRLLAGVSAVSIAALAPGAAQAAGTASGTVVTNTASVGYAVSGVTQTAVTATAAFTVDRKVSLTVAELGNTTTSVVPGATGQVTSFTVTNTSNAPLDFGLTSLQTVGGVSVHGGTDNFNVTVTGIFVDANGNGVYDVGTDTATFIDELAADGSRTVFVVATVPNPQANGSVAEVALVAQAAEPGVTGTQGANVADSGASTAPGLKTVLADTAGPATGDVARDGKHSSEDDYTVAGAALSVVKSSTLLWDPFNGNTNPRYIPGAVVEYCIAVTNGAGALTAAGVTISDGMPKVPSTTIQAVDYYGAASAAATNGDAAPAVLRNVDGAGNCTGGTPGGTTTGTSAANNEVVGGPLSDIAAGTSRSLRFRAKVR